MLEAVNAFVTLNFSYIKDGNRLSTTHQIPFATDRSMVGFISPKTASFDWYVGEKLTWKSHLHGSHLHGFRYYLTLL